MCASERGRASVGLLFTSEIPVNNGGLEASSFREKNLVWKSLGNFGKGMFSAFLGTLQVGLGTSQTIIPFPETLMH